MSTLIPSKSRKPFYSFVASLTAGLFFLSSFSPLMAAVLKLGKDAPPVILAPGSPALALQNAFIEAAAAVSPAVVNISVDWTENQRGFNDFGDMDDFFNYFFYGPNGPRGGRRRAPQTQQQHSLGSGFLISADGYIVTNAHVIAKAEKVTVTLADGTAYPAKVVGKDENTDIGVVKISDGKKSFPYVALGNSDGVKVGQWAIAIGDPFGFDHTVTTGIISAKGRNLPRGGEIKGFQHYIQTDASINPGNSGGPLCNIQGEVIGINTAIISQSGGSIGIGFAIPINLAKKVAGDLTNGGKVVRAGLGAVVQNLNSKMAKSFGLTSTEGALISGVNPGSAAEKSGLKPGDIVLAMDGTMVDNSGELVSRLYSYQPGQTIQLKVLRNGNEVQIPVTLQTLSEKDLKFGERSSEGDEEQAKPRESADLGMAYQDQTPELQQQLPEGAPKGPVIMQVAPQSPAEAAGLQRGDIVLKVGNTPIFSANQLRTVLKKSDLKEGVRLFVWRDGETLFGILQTEE